ncbi:MAG: hypothetical protein IPQ22_15070 [Rhodoferax sp.]|nr:hypothetical protein [Rhodoferax sp.]
MKKHPLGKIYRLHTHGRGFESGNVRPNPLQGLDAAPPQFRLLVEALQMYLPILGQAQPLANLELTAQSKDEWTLQVHGAGFGVSMGVFNECPHAQDVTPRFRLFLIRTLPTGPFGIGKETDVTVCYAHSAGRIVETIGGIIARTASRQVFQVLQAHQPGHTSEGNGYLFDIQINSS